VRPGLTVLSGAALLLLLVACANTAGLLFARGVGRERELAVHVALGASRGQLVRRLIVECLVLAAAGGAAGLLLSFAGVRAVRALAPPELPRIETLTIDARGALFAAAVAAGAALLAGLAPALRLSRRSAAESLRGASMGAVSEREGQAWRRRLVVAEMAAALVLLCAATLLGQSLARLLSNPLGFTPERRASLQVFLWDRNPTPAQRLARAEAIRQRLAAVPGVEGVGIVTAQPFHPSQIDAMGVFLVEGRPVSATERPPRVFTTMASPEYFGVMEIPLRQGRVFTNADLADAPAVAVINETIAGRLFPDEDPVGKRVKISAMGPPVEREIVGVVGDVLPTSFDSQPRPEAYVPLAQSGNGSLTFVAETRSRPEAVLPALRAAVTEVDPGQSVYTAGPVEEMVRATTRDRRFVLALTTATAALALALTAVGVAGLFAYTTRRRRREFGIRLALGARRSQVAGMVLSEAARLGAIGVVVGLAASLAANRSLSALLYGVRPTDAGALGVAAGALLLLAVAGAAIPALRAAATPPATTLRQE
jgi:predicted permease